MDHTESLRSDHEACQKEINSINQMTEIENEEAERIKEEVPQIKENIAWRQKQHEILLAEQVAKNQNDQSDFESTRFNDEAQLREMEVQYQNEDEALRIQYAEIRPQADQIKLDQKNRLHE